MNEEEIIAEMLVDDFTPLTTALATEEPGKTESKQ